MQVVGLKDDKLLFEMDNYITGTCELEIRDLHDDYYVVLSNIQATDVVGEVELEYILTDAEVDELHDRALDYVNEYIIDDLLDPERYFDEDAWKYDA
jgi:hypothetical protein